MALQGNFHSGYANPASILVATDLTEMDRLFPIALEQAQETGAQLLLLHVLTAATAITVDPAGLPYYDPASAVQFAEAALLPYCIKARAAGVECNSVIREGSAPQQIENAIRKLQADRLVMGTRSRGKLGKLLIGSVAEQVLRSVNIPVITVGPEAHPTEAGTRRSVLLATSLREASRPCAALACEIARCHQAHLIVMHVLRDFELDTDRKQIEQQLSSLVPEEMICNCTAETFVTSGNPAIEILAKASESNTSLIVLSAADRSALQNMASDGTIYRVLAHARCPVMSLRQCNLTEADNNRQNLVAHSAGN
jgi:nucleotide-binding universal stress UspA family protein